MYLTSLFSLQSPQSLAKEGGYDHEEALFGNPPDGTVISENVYYANSEMCDDSKQTDGYPARPIGLDGTMEPFPSPFILMVDRRGHRCTFVEQVRVSLLLLLSRVFLCKHF